MSEVMSNPAQKVQELMNEARALAGNHVENLLITLAQTRRLAAEIAEGGDAYPAGIRDAARQLADECESRGQTLQAIQARMSS